MKAVKILLVCSLYGACFSCSNADTRESPQKVYQRTYNDAVAEGLGHDSAQNRALLLQLENSQKPKGTGAKIVDGVVDGFFDAIFGFDDDSDEDFFR